jgi:hypothetical protein
MMRRRRRRDQLDFFLAGGNLARPTLDRIADQVIARQAPGPRRRRALLALTSALGVAAAVLVMVQRPPSGAQPNGAFSVKGPAGPSLQVECAQGPRSACPIGSTLLFSISGPADGYLSAFAEPVRAGGERIWYFSGDGTSPYLRGGGDRRILTQGVLVGSEHAPGEYVVHLLLTRSPLSRSEVLSPPSDTILGRASAALRIVRP